MILFLHHRYRTTGGEERVVSDLRWLAEEHLVIHDHLERVDDLAVAVHADPSRIAELVEAVAELRVDLESHFAYEETEMAEPLGLLGLGV